MVDLHVHTCLSPCGELEMHPAAVVAGARDLGLSAIAVCDHNSAANVTATVRAGVSAGVAVIPGMEIATEEEVHVLGWFPDIAAALRLQERVYAALPGKNDARVFGDQVVADEHGNVLAFEDRLLIGATRWTIDRVVQAIHEEGGLAVAAHVDRERFGLVGQLGFIPPDLPLDALEVSARMPLDEARARFGAFGDPIVTGSDAHQPDALGRCITWMLLDTPGFEDIRLALAGREGRAVLGGGRPMEDLSLHLLDVAQNAVEAGATRVEISVEEHLDRDLLVIEVRDNGRGMDKDTVARVTDPFYTTRTTRRVGLGLSLLSATAKASGGTLAIDSVWGQGTRVRATFVRSHIDRPPIGDLETTVVVFAAGSPELDLVFRHALGDRSFELDTAHLRAVLGGQPLDSPDGLAALRDAMRRGEAGLLTPAPAGKGAA